MMCILYFFEYGPIKSLKGLMTFKLKLLKLVNKWSKLKNNQGSPTFSIKPSDWARAQPLASKCTQPQAAWHRAASAQMWFIQRNWTWLHCCRSLHPSRAEIQWFQFQERWAAFYPLMFPLHPTLHWWTADTMHMLH